MIFAVAMVKVPETREDRTQLVHSAKRDGDARTKTPDWLSLLIDWDGANRTSSRLVFASGMLAFGRNQRDEKPSPSLLREEPLRHVRLWTSAHMMDSCGGFKSYFGRKESFFLTHS
jgi:hypothetical protein